MNRRNTPLGLFFIFLLLAALPFKVNVVTAQQSSASQRATKTLRLAGLRAPVNVRRDERGIPYIEATNDADLYFAQGYVTASDRLWQMDLLRRTARGELSEIFGRATLEEDKRRRTYGFARVAEASVAHIPPHMRSVVEAYARGVNAYIASLDENSLPLEFRVLRYRPRAWTPADSMVLGKNFAEALSTTWPTDLMRASLVRLPPEKFKALLPETSPLDVLVVGTDRVDKKSPVPPRRMRDVASVGSDETLRALAEVEDSLRRSLERIGLYAEERAASNNWVVSGRRTASGKPLLANDPHLAPSAPSIWYLTHLSAPGMRVAGVATPGAPGIIIGHNERIAWGMTNLGPDVQDLYREKFDTENARRYMTPAGWREAEVRREEIKVRKSQTDTATETVALDVTVTRHGPIVFESDGARYALRWTALDPQLREFDALLLLNRARNWREFQNALRNYPGPTQNFVYADVSGHIGYYGAGRIPVRSSGDGSFPYDGSTDAGEWTSFIPFDQLPHVFDPASGIIVTANNRLVGQSYPHHLTHEWSPPVRARRIYEMLTAKPRLTADDFRRVQGDAHSIFAREFAREIVAVARESGLAEKDEKWRETVRLLDGWDGEIVPESRAARLASEIRTVFFQKILDATLGTGGDRRYRWDNATTFYSYIMRERPAEWLPKEYKSYAELLDDSHREARSALAKRLGDDESQWTWGREATVRFPHPLAGASGVGAQFLVEPFPQKGTGGSFATPNVGAHVSMRLIADPSNWDNTQHGIALGESGNPASPHWKDQLDDWRAATPRAFPFTARAVAAATRETLVLAPAR